MGAKIKSAEGVDAITVADDGKVGIGTDNPGSKLDVAVTGVTSIAQFSASIGGNGGLGAVTIKTTSSPNSGLVFSSNSTSSLIKGGALAASVYNSENAPLLFGTNDTERVRIDADGKFVVDVNRTSDDTNSTAFTAGGTLPVIAWRAANSVAASPFAVKRPEAATGSAVFITFGVSASSVLAAGTGIGGIRRNSGNTAFEFYNTSDERLKNVKGEFSAALEKVEGIPVKWYSWKTSPDQEHFRFIAQDVQKHIPSAVFEDEEGHLQLGESDMFPVLWQAVRELKAELDEAKAEIAALRKQP
jgi:hypothetical protein